MNEQKIRILITVARGPEQPWTFTFEEASPWPGTPVEYQRQRVERLAQDCIKAAFDQLFEGRLPVAASIGAST